MRTRRPGTLAFDFRSEDEAVRGLIDAMTLAQAESCVEALVGIGYAWVPLGGKEGNYGLVNIGSDPGLAFVEPCCANSVARLARCLAPRTRGQRRTST